MSGALNFFCILLTENTIMPGTHNWSKYLGLLGSHSHTHPQPWVTLWVTLLRGQRILQEEVTADADKFL